MTIKEFRTAISLTSTDLAIIVMVNDEVEIVAYDSDGIFKDAKFQRFCKSSENQYDVDNLVIDYIYAGFDDFGDPSLKIICSVYTDEQGNIVKE